jgi:hypothetical protein
MRYAFQERIKEDILVTDIENKARVYLKVVIEQHSNP